MGLGEALEDGVWPLVKGGELKRLEGADGQTGGNKTGEADRCLTGFDTRSNFDQCIVGAEQLFFFYISDVMPLSIQ